MPHPTQGPRVAILGLHLEANAFAPITTEKDFRGRSYLVSDAIMCNQVSLWPAAALGLFGRDQGRLDDRHHVPLG
jgi:hypothetical protein